MAHHPVMARVAPALLALLVSTAAAFAAPQSITGLTSANSLSPDEVRRIESYVEDLLDRLRDAADDPAEVRDIRRDFISPVARGSTSGIFLDKYSRASLDGLEGIVSSGNPHTSANALIVMSNLGTERALDTLLRHVSVRDEDQRFNRLTAARGCEQLFRNRHFQDAMPKKITTAARRLAAAAKVETDPLTLRHLGLAIFAAGQMEKLQAAPRQQIQGYLIEVLESVGERAAAASATEDPIGMLAAVYPVLHGLRNAYLETDSQTLQKKLGRQLGPCLRALLEVATAHWAMAQQQPRHDGQPGNTINLCERFLTVIDRFVRSADPPETDMKHHWDMGDETRYKADLDLWDDILNNAPY
ncbi:MAG: hypothetical protein GY715_07955 [Planctomycetes bacterium]|nr:hypothetical protein [Planctomycetota bacterium]